MPDQLPSLSAREVIKALKKCGFHELRQTGSHLIMYNETADKRVVIPVHAGKDIKRPLLRKIITVEAEMTIEAFIKLL